MVFLYQGLGLGFQGSLLLGGSKVVQIYLYGMVELFCYRRKGRAKGKFPYYVVVRVTFVCLGKLGRVLLFHFVSR